MSRCKNKSLLSIFVAVVMVMCGVKSTAQSTEFGIRVMPTVSNFEIQNSSGGVIFASSLISQKLIC